MDQKTRKFPADAGWVMWDGFGLHGEVGRQARDPAPSLCLNGVAYLQSWSCQLRGPFRVLSSR